MLRVECVVFGVASILLRIFKDIDGYCLSWAEKANSGKSEVGDWALKRLVQPSAWGLSAGGLRWGSNPR
ncbi:MAG: hypothetical protein QW702_03340 [Candidatus Bathyarchaeia archaeon]